MDDRQMHARFAVRRAATHTAERWRARTTGAARGDRSIRLPDTGHTAEPVDLLVRGDQRDASQEGGWRWSQLSARLRSHVAVFTGSSSTVALVSRRRANSSIGIPRSSLPRWILTPSSQIEIALANPPSR